MCRIDTFELHNRNAHSPAERRPVVMPPFLRVIASMWERSTFLCPPHASTPSKKTQERATNAIVFNIIACGCSFCPKWIAPSSTTSTTTCSAQHGPALASTRSSIYSADVSRFPAFQCCSKRPRTLVVDVCVCGVQLTSASPGVEPKPLKTGISFEHGGLRAVFWLVMKPYSEYVPKLACN